MNKKTRQGTKTLIFIFSSSAGAETSQPTRFPQLMWSHRRMRRKSEYTWPFLCRLVVMSLWSVSLTTTWESLVKSLILVSVKVCCFIRNTQIWLKFVVWFLLINVVMFFGSAGQPKIFFTQPLIGALSAAAVLLLLLLVVFYKWRQVRLFIIRGISIEVYLLYWPVLSTISLAV